jgi:hypothetical protein
MFVQTSDCNTDDLTMSDKEPNQTDLSSLESLPCSLFPAKSCSGELPTWIRPLLESDNVLSGSAYPDWHLKQGMHSLSIQILKQQTRLGLLAVKVGRT